MVIQPPSPLHASRTCGRVQHQQPLKIQSAGIIPPRILRKYLEVIRRPDFRRCHASTGEIIFLPPVQGEAYYLRPGLG